MQEVSVIIPRVLHPEHGMCGAQQDQDGRELTVDDASPALIQTVRQRQS